MRKRVELRIHGRVQGVCFRLHAQEQAIALGLAGHVCNRRDGSVELVAEGTPEAIQAILDWSQQGPPSARVERVDTQSAEARGEEHGFVIAPTR